LLAILIVTASIGGALITLSLKKTRTESPLRTVLRAIGGGIVCYLAVDGGSIPLNVGDVSNIASPATASLYGLLAGMFSERGFGLLSDIVDAFLSRLTPSRENSPEDSLQVPISPDRLSLTANLQHHVLQERFTLLYGGEEDRVTVGTTTDL
jgi:hypothetical protein